MPHIAQECRHHMISSPSWRAEQDESSHRLPENAEPAATASLDDVADDVVADVGGKELLEQPDADANHVGSSPTSSPAAMRRNDRIDASSARDPAGVTR